MHEVLDIAKLVLIIIVSLIAFLLILKFSVDMEENFKKINNIKKLKKRMDTMAAAATVFKTCIIEKGKEGKFRLVLFEYTADEKTYCRKMLLTHSAFNEVSKGDKIYIYYEKNNPENCILKEDWEERTYKYYIQWDIAYILCILIFVAVNCLMKLV
ncbi:MAG: hypothetical protein K2J79_08555 [Ruminiclostridium sp.]|nr:hypothetical protein [Ruminiclostridium sp.]